MSPLESEVREMARDNKLPMGQTSFIDVRSGEVLNVMIWAMGGIFYLNRYTEDHPDYWTERKRAAKNLSTIYRDKDS